MKTYAKLTGDAWFILPTLAVTRYTDGERAAAVIWLNLEVGVRW